MKHVIGVGVSLLVGALVIFGVWQGLAAWGNLGYEPAAVAAARVSTRVARLGLSVFPNSYPCHGSGSGAPGGGPNPAWVTYCASTSLVMPAHSTVIVTIKMYDSSTRLHNSFFSQVRGTLGGTEQVNGRSVRSLGAGRVAHTFTIQTPPDTAEPQLFVNVPLAGVSPDASTPVVIAGHRYPRPNVITFRIRTGAPGKYVWHCYDPCGTGLAGINAGFGGPMATTGYMAGTLTVAGS